MGQLGFFDLNRRYESLDKKSDPLAGDCQDFRVKAGFVTPT